MGIFLSIPTKSALKKALKRNEIAVNGEIASTATFIEGGEKIEFNPLDRSIQSEHVNVQLEVLFEDEFLAAVYKPAGILVSGNKLKTIAHALPENLHKSVQADTTIPQPVHRLDYPTTGVLLVGKTVSSIQQLNQLFEQKNISKTYYAICIGNMIQKGEITDPIDEKKAISEFEVLETVKSERFTALNLVKFLPKTGRRHQLRKHAESIGNPILGDKDYGKPNLVLKGKGLYLHAYSLEFIHPVTQENIKISKPLPEKFQKIFNLASLEA